MKLLWFPICHWPQHFETDLELMTNARERSDEVFVIKCNGSLPACFMSRKKNTLNCMACQSMFKKGLKAAGIPNKNVHELPFCKEDTLQIPLVFKNIEEVISFQFMGVELGMAAASNYTWLHDREHKFNPTMDGGELYRDIVAGAMVYLGTKKIIEKIKPDKFVFFNGRFPTYRSILRLCEQMGIQYQIHERCGDVNRYWLIDNATPHTLEYCRNEIVKVWDSGGSDNVDKATQWFIDRRKGVPQGWLSYVNNQQQGLIPDELFQNKDKKAVVIYNTTIAEYFGVKEWDFGIYPDQNEGIERIITEFDDNPEYMFYLRIHPNLSYNKTNSQLIELQEIKKRHKNLVLIQPDSPVSSYALLDVCNIVLVFGSTVGVEACFWGKPAILASRSYYESVNACYQPKTHEELVSLIKTELAPLPKERALPYAYWEIARGNKFKWFVPNGISKGVFKGINIYPHICIRLILKIVRLFIQIRL